MRLASAARGSGFLAIASLLCLGATALAGDLALSPLLISDSDLSGVVPLAGGQAMVLSDIGIDRVAAGNATVSIARRAEGQHLVLGESGRYVGVVTHREGAADFTPTAAFELRDASGALVWRMGETEDVTYAISAGGTVVGMSLNINIAERNRLHFYGFGGTLLATVDAPHLTGGSFVPDGEIFLALSMTEGVTAYDPTSGSPLWSVPGGRFFAPVPGGTRVAVVGDDRLTLIGDGKVLATRELEGLLVRRLAIASDGSRVAVAGKHEIRVFEAPALAPILSIDSGGESLSWTSIDIAPAGGWLLAGVAHDLGRSVPVEQRHPDGEVRAYDATGRLAHSARMSFPIWNIWTPTVLLDDSGEAATVTTRRAVYRTVLP